MHIKVIHKIRSNLKTAAVNFDMTFILEHDEAIFQICRFKIYCVGMQAHRHTQSRPIALLGPLK